MQVLRFEQHPESFLFISAWFPLGHSIQHLPVNTSVPELKSSKMQVMTRNCYHLYLPFLSPIPRCGCYSKNMLKNLSEGSMAHINLCSMVYHLCTPQKSPRQLQPSKMPFWAEELFLPNHWTGINISSSSGVREREDDSQLGKMINIPWQITSQAVSFH